MQGPLVIVAEHPSADLVETLASAGSFPIVETIAADASRAIAAAKPGAILLADAAATGDPALAQWLAQEITPLAPIVPVLALVQESQDIPYREALPVAADASPKAIAARLSAALRARTLHGSVLRRAEAAVADGHPLPEVPRGDPLEDATVVVAGRGRAYPDLSVALGARAGTIGTLSIETAARYLKSREIDGLVIGDGFGARNVEAFLAVVAEDNRFRDLPIGVLSPAEVAFDYENPNVIVVADPAQLVARIIPFVRLHAFEERLRRILCSFDNKGMIDPETGLLRHEAFMRDLERILRDAKNRGTGLSIARFTFEAGLDERASKDAARLVSRLVRGVDFGCRDQDGSILIVFAETDLRHAHVVARRIASVLKHTMLNGERDREPAAPGVTLAARKSSDSVASLLERVSVPAIAAE
jgi:GGDEF domain-containing protein